MKTQKSNPTGSGFTLVELLVVILIISVLAGFLVPTVMTGRKRVQRVQCVNRLSNIGKMSQLFADDHRSWFPVAQVEDPKAYESLQMLVNSMNGARSPELYQCPASNDLPPKVDKSQTIPFTLGEDNVSYTWRNKPLKTGSARALLSCDNSIKIKTLSEENHEGGMNVMHADASVKWLSLDSDLVGDPKNGYPGDKDYQDGGLEGYFAANKLGM